MAWGLLVACVSGAILQPAGNQGASKSPVPFPHPLISEVLYAVPSGHDGDANKDGERSATGDEFVELVNPHDKPIQLRGYMITDGTPLDASEHTPNARTQIHFTFPDCELKPGQVVVVFNGYKQMVPGPVGDSAKGPSGTNPNFGNAIVFSMRVPTQYAAFNNDGDCVVVRDPKGKSVQAIKWGDYKGPSAIGAPLVEDAPKSVGSVQRVGLSKQLVPHPDLKPGALFSPGEFDMNAELPGASRVSKPETKTGAKPAPKQLGKPDAKPAKDPKNDPKPETKPDAPSSSGG